MNYVTRLFSGVKYYYDGINGATLTGALDVIVIKQPDGSFSSSPFHVRFGKLNVLRSTEKVVEITVNGEVVDLHMKLGHNGEAFFVKLIDDSDEDPFPDILATSPIQCDAGSVMEQGIAQMKKANSAASVDYRSGYHLAGSGSGYHHAERPECSTTHSADTAELRTNELDLLIGESEEDDSFGEDDFDFDKAEGTGSYWQYRGDECLSDSELVTPSLAHCQSSHLEENTNLHWSWGNLPQETGQNHSEEDSSFMKGMWEYIGRRKRKNTFSGTMERQEGMYLDDIDPDDALTMSHYFGVPERGRRRSKKPSYLDDEDVRELAKNEAQFRRLDALSLEAPRYHSNSIIEHIGATSSTHTQTSKGNKRNKRTQTPYNSDITGHIQLSLCGQLTDKFNDSLVSFDQIDQDRSLLDDPNLVVKFDNEFYNWNEAHNTNVTHNSLLCAIAFNQCRASSSIPFGLCDDTPSSLHNSTLDPEDDPRPRYKKTVRLESADIAQLGLKYGANLITFSVTTSYQGTTECACSIYLWNYTDKILISDIDGTITRSDVFGHILPWVGKDWTQNDIAKLFTALQHNGYKFLYLSSRAIGQASMTKSFLRTIKQNGLGIPEGPMLLSPDSLFRAMHAELVLRQPYIFKIQCLTDIKNLFPKHYTPFYCGFGNRFSDSKSYQAVEIPLQRIYLINHKGVIRTENSLVQQCTYGEIFTNIDAYFPPVDPTRNEIEVEFLSQNYWRSDIMELSESDFEL